MADVQITPRIQCDNCGFTEAKTPHDEYGKVRGVVYRKPKTWGGCSMEGTRDADAYGNKERLDMSDLCPVCASNALNAAAKALALVREDVKSGLTK